MLEICDSFSVSKGTGFLHPLHWTGFQALGGWVRGEQKGRHTVNQYPPVQPTRKEGRKDGWMDGWMISDKETIFC